MQKYNASYEGFLKVHGFIIFFIFDLFYYCHDQIFAYFWPSLRTLPSYQNQTIQFMDDNNSSLCTCNACVAKYDTNTLHDFFLRS